MIKDKVGGTEGRVRATPFEVALATDFGKHFDLDFDASIRVVKLHPHKMVQLAILEVKLLRSTSQEGVPHEHEELKRIANWYGLEVDYGAA